MAFRFALAPLLRLRQSIERQRTLQLQQASLPIIYDSLGGGHNITFTYTNLDALAVPAVVGRAATANLQRYYAE